MQPFKMTLAAALAAICVAAGPSAAGSSEADGAGCTGASVREMRVHSHNDYAQKRPFWGAYEAGADSIEADVFLEGGELLVAHSRKELKKENTLRRLYLEPLRTVFRKNGGRARANGKPLQLVIDLKSGKPALDALLAMIEREGFRECFDIAKNPSAARLSVGGDISEIKDFLSYPDYVFFSVIGNYDRLTIKISDYSFIAGVESCRLFNRYFITDLLPAGFIRCNRNRCTIQIVMDSILGIELFISCLVSIVFHHVSDLMIPTLEGIGEVLIIRSGRSVFRSLNLAGRCCGTLVSAREASA